MINAETFLANLRSSNSVPEEYSDLVAEDFPDLPLSIVQILNRGWAVAPVLAHSISASVKRSMVGSPTSSLPFLVSVTRKYLHCNWALATGNGLLILEVNTEIGMPALRELAKGDWKWRETLRFRSGGVHFFAFYYSGRRVRFLGNRFPGLKSHWNGSAVLIPPSWFVFGPPVSYVSDLDADVIDAPPWLLGPSEIGE
jgi:hypothetical protein